MRRAGTARPTVARGVIAGLVVALGAAVVAWWLWPTGETRQDAASTKQGLIKEVTPAKAAKADSSVPEKKEPAKPKLTGSQLRDLRNGRVLIPPAYTCGVHHVSIERKLFTNGAEQSLAILLMAEPGESFIGDPHDYYDNPKFRQAIQDAVASKIEFSDDDTEYGRQLKESVIEAKKELFERVRNGEDAVQIFIDTFKELQNLGLYKQDLEAEIKRAIKDGSLSDEDVQDTLAAANKMLAERGIGAVRMPGMFKNRVKLIEKQRKAQEAAKDSAGKGQAK